MLSVTLILLLFELTFAKIGFGPGEQDWGYANVREKGHIFWWLYYTTANVSHPTERPLIIWLQGGPGGSSTAIGNFVEIGPLDEDLNVRNTTWVQHANVLFVDNPVGTGFSYVDDGGVYAQNNSEIARDFLDFLIQFYDKLPNFRTVPMYIFGESYGGKMTVEIAVELDKAIKEKQIKANFKGIGLGDSWIAPMDYIFTWAPYLFNLGLLDEKGFEQINSIALKAQKSYEKGDYNMSTVYWALTEVQIVNETANVDFYNILNKIHTDPNFVNKDLDYSYLNKILAKVKNALKLKSEGVAESDKVFEALYTDFMKPVTHLVETLLNSTNITVTVYNGQLDLITDTPGTLKWINHISFKDKNLWQQSERKPFVVNGIIEGFVKKYQNFGFYWVHRAGHMVYSYRRNGQMRRLHNHDFANFPVFDLDYLKDLTIGIYQIKLAPSYIQDKIIRENDEEFQIDENMDEPGFIRVRIFSRFRQATKHQVFIFYTVDEDNDEDEPVEEPINGYYCTCQSGATTVGTCAHITSVLWFLGFARHQPNVKYPDRSLVNTMYDASNRNQQNVNTRIVEYDLNPIFP